MSNYCKVLHSYRLSLIEGYDSPHTHTETFIFQQFNQKLSKSLYTVNSNYTEPYQSSDELHTIWVKEPQGLVGFCVSHFHHLVLPVSFSAWCLNSQIQMVFDGQHTANAPLRLSITWFCGRVGRMDVGFGAVWCKKCEIFDTPCCNQVSMLCQSLCHILSIIRLLVSRWTASQTLAQPYDKPA